MDKKAKAYEIATWILSIVVILLVILLVNSHRKFADSGIEEARTVLKDCNEKLATWRLDNPTVSDSTPEAQQELLDILKGCAGSASSDSANVDDTATQPAS